MNAILLDIWNGGESACAVVLGQDQRGLSTSLATTKHGSPIGTCPEIQGNKARNLFFSATLSAKSHRVKAFRHGTFFLHVFACRRMSLQSCSILLT